METAVAFSRAASESLLTRQVFNVIHIANCFGLFCFLNYVSIMR